MARRNTPPRGSGPPLYGGGGGPAWGKEGGSGAGGTPPRGGPAPPLGGGGGGARDGGRPRVRELSALEGVVAVEGAREQQRQRPAREPQLTKKEALLDEP